MKRLYVRLGVVLVVALGVLALIALPGEARKKKNKKAWDPTDRPFNHDEHDKKVKAKGTSSKCSDCHTAKKDGTLTNRVSLGPEHNRCASKCHGGGSFKHKMPSKRQLGSNSSIKSFYQSDAGRVCYVCHPIAKKIQPRNGLSQVNNKPEGTVEHGTYFSHKLHTKPGQSTGRQCEACHGKFGSGAPKTGGLLSDGHKKCSACHERGMDPLMNDCGGCHVDKDSPKAMKAGTARGPNKYAMTKSFDHDRHAREDRVGTDGRDCLVCHDNIAKAKNDMDLPLPTMMGCYKACHNGKKAFDATGATCTRCHQGGRK